MRLKHLGQFMKILIIDDESEIRELMRFSIELEGDHNISEAANGQEGIDLLGSNQNVDLVICDYQMPKKSGGDVQAFMLEKGIKAKFVLSSAYKLENLESIDKDNVFHNIVKPDITDGIQSLFNKLKEGEQEMSPVSKYIPININLLFKTGLCPCDVYIQLSDEKALKILNKDDAFSEEDYNKYNDKGVVQLLIESSHARDCIRKVEENIKVLLSNLDTENIDKSVEVQEFVHSTAQSLGLSQELLEIAKDGVTFAINIIKKNNELKKALKKLCNSQKDFIPCHSVAMSYITCGIASQMKWNSELTMCKLALASLIHDISIEDAALNEASVISSGNFSDAFKQHPVNSASKLNELKDIPPDVDKIITEHHEQPDGSGFPRGINYTQISPLGMVFIISHKVAEHVIKLKADGNDVTQDNLVELIDTDFYNKGGFKKVVSAFKEAKIFD
jgi:response regulator RpfG family c-di-GMP phosphodiesterase